MEKFNGEIKLAVTHDGQFHADDVCAGAILQMVNPHVEIQRTRNPKEFEKADIVFDVGMEFDPSRGRYDHHQREKAGVYPNGIEYSSAGLIWDAVGHRIDGVTEEVHAIVSRKFIQPIDAQDNGQQLAKATGQYEGVFNLSLSGVIASLNKVWNELSYEGAYESALMLMSIFLRRAIASARGTELAKDLVLAAVKSSKNQIIVLEQFVPWQETIHAIDSNSLYVVFQGEKGDWLVQAIPVSPGSYTSRKALPASWGGLSQSELVKLTGVEDVVFCHPKLFICGAKSKEGALALAELAKRQGFTSEEVRRFK